MHTNRAHTMPVNVTSDKASFIVRLAQKIGISNRSVTIFGDPLERYGVTMIPVAKARWHSAGSSTQTESDTRGGTGAAAWATVSPTGYVIIKDGKPRYQPILNVATILPWLLGSSIVAALVLGAVRRLRH